MTVHDCNATVSTDVQVNQQLSLYISETGWTNCLWTPAVFFVSITGLVAENLHRWAKSWGESHMPTPCFAKAINMAMMLLGRIIAGFSVGLLSGNAGLHQRDRTPCVARRAGHGVPVRHHGICSALGGPHWAYMGDPSSDACWFMNPYPYYIYVYIYILYHISTISPSH